MDLKKLNNSGQGLVEYSVLLMLIAMVIFAALQALGDTVNTEFYQQACSAIVNASR